MASPSRLGLVSAPHAIAAGIALPIVTAAVVALRFFTRHERRLGIGLDDWLTLPALLLTTGMCVSLLTSVELGLKQYSADDPSATPDGATPAFYSSAKSLWSFQLQMYPAHAFIKISILHFYRRMLRQHMHSTLCLATNITTAIVLLWSLAFLLLNIFDCGADVALNWAPLPTYAERCTYGVKLEQGFAISDFIIDLLILLLPLPAVWTMQMRTSLKLATTAVLLLAFSSIGASIARLVLYTSPIDPTTFPSVGAFVSFMMRFWSTMMYWSVIEAALALQAACLPTLRHLLPAKLRSLQGPSPAERNVSNLSRGPGSTLGSRFSSRGIGLVSMNREPAGHQGLSMVDRDILDFRRWGARDEKTTVEDSISFLEI